MAKMGGHSRASPRTIASAAATNDGPHRAIRVTCRGGDRPRWRGLVACSGLSAIAGSNNEPVKRQLGPRVEVARSSLRSAPRDQTGYVEGARMSAIVVRPRALGGKALPSGSCLRAGVISVVVAPHGTGRRGSWAASTTSGARSGDDESRRSRTLRDLKGTVMSRPHDRGDPPAISDRGRWPGVVHRYLTASNRRTRPQNLDGMLAACDLKTAIRVRHAGAGASSSSFGMPRD